MIKAKKITSIIFIILISALFVLGGCTPKEDTLVTIGDKKLTLDDFRYDIYLIEAEGNSLNEYYTTNLGIGYWDYEQDGITIRDAAKNTILTRVIMYEILTDQAKKAGLSLTEDELLANEAAVDTFIKNTTDVGLATAGLSRELLVKAYNKFSLGDKYYLELSKGFQIDKDAITNSIAAEDYREYKTECLYVPTISSANQQITPLSEEELKAAYASITEALNQITTGYDFDKILAENDKLTKYSRNFILQDNVPEEEYREAAAKLENGEYSEIVSTNFGYYIIHMLDSNSSERYEKAIQDAVKAEENKQFEAVYNNLKTQYDIQLNSENWDKITLGSITTGNK